MLTFDVNFAFKPVRYFKKAILEECGIPEDKQVLIVSGGECLETNAKICTYSAGTDTNPIFLFNKLCIENPTTTISKIDNENDLVIKEQVEGSLMLLPSYTTLVARTQLAQQLNDMAKKEMLSCERTVHDQHVMQQAWAAVTANLDDTVKAFETRAQAMFAHYNNRYLPILRPKYTDLVGQLPRDCGLLADLPFVLAPVTTPADNGRDGDGAPPTLSFLDWIRAKDSKGDLSQLIDTCRLNVERYGDGMLHEMRAEYTVAMDATRNQSMKEIRGLEDRLYGLEQLMHEARTSLNQQNELTQGFLQNQHRASKENDPSILPDLCSSHKRQLLFMLKNYQHIKDISQRCRIAKEELASNLNARLRWVSFVEKQICVVDGKICAHYNKLREMERKFAFLHQIHTSPFLYVASILEIIRRKKFSSAYSQVINAIWGKLEKIYSVETHLREMFTNLTSDHFIQTLLPCIHETVPIYGITDRPPSQFDTVLRTIPDLSLSKRYLVPDHSSAQDEQIKSFCDNLAAGIDRSLVSSVTLLDTLNRVIGSQNTEYFPAGIPTDSSRLGSHVDHISHHDNDGVDVRIQTFCQRYHTSVTSGAGSLDSYPIPLFGNLSTRGTDCGTEIKSCYEDHFAVELDALRYALSEPATTPRTANLNTPIAPTFMGRYIRLPFEPSKCFETKTKCISEPHIDQILASERSDPKIHPLSLLRALTLANTSLPKGRKRWLDEIRFLHLAQKMLRITKEFQSVKRHAQTNASKISFEMDTFGRKLHQTLSTYERTTSQKNETSFHEMEAYYVNRLREYEIKIDLQEAASDDATDPTHSTTRSNVGSPTNIAIPIILPLNISSGMYKEKIHLGVDIPSYALRVELQSELIKAKSLAQAASYEANIKNLLSLLSQRDARIAYLESVADPDSNNLKRLVEYPGSKFTSDDFVDKDDPTGAETQKTKSRDNLDTVVIFNPVVIAGSSSSPLPGEAEAEDGSYYFDDYDYGDGCDLSMVMSTNSPTPDPPSHSLPPLRYGTSNTGVKNDDRLAGSRVIPKDPDVRDITIPDSTSLLFLSSLGDDTSEPKDNDTGCDITYGAGSDDSDKRSILLEDSHDLAPTPFLPEIPYLRTKANELPYLEIETSIARNEPSSPIVSGEASPSTDESLDPGWDRKNDWLRIVEYLEFLSRANVQDLVVSLHHRIAISHADDASITIDRQMLENLLRYERNDSLMYALTHDIAIQKLASVRDSHIFDNICHILNTYHGLNARFTLRPPTNYANLNCDLFETSVLNDLHPIHSYILTLSLLENLWHIRNENINFSSTTKGTVREFGLNENTEATNQTLIINKDDNLGRYHSFTKDASFRRSYVSTSLEFLDLDNDSPKVYQHQNISTQKEFVDRDISKSYYPPCSQPEPKLPAALHQSLILSQLPTSESKFVKSNKDTQTGPLPDQCQTPVTPKSHHHPPKLTLNNCSTGDYVVFYRDRDHRDNYVAFTLDPETHFLHSDSFPNFGLVQDKGTIIMHQNSFVVGRVLSKELCLAKKFPNRFQVPLGTKFYRVRLAPLTNDTSSSGYLEGGLPVLMNGSQILERFVVRSRDLFDKLFK